MRKQKLSIGIAFIFNLFLFLSASPSGFSDRTDFDSTALSSRAASSLSLASLPEPFVEEASLQMTEHEFATLMEWEVNLKFSEENSQDSGLFFEYIGHNRIEFGHFWPQYSHKMYPFFPLTLFFHRKLLRLLFVSGEKAEIRYLLENNLIDWSRPLIKTVNGRRNYHTFLSLYLLPEPFDLEIFRLLFQFFPKDMLDCHCGDGNTALTAAIRKGRVEVVRALLAAGANPNICVLGMGSAPFLAMKYGSVEMISLVASCGRIDLNQTDSRQRSLAAVMVLLNRPEAIVFYAGVSYLKALLRSFQLEFALACLHYLPKFISAEFATESFLYNVKLNNLQALVTLLAAFPSFKFNCPDEFTLSAICFSIQNALVQKNYSLCSALAGTVDSLNDLVVYNGASLPCYIAGFGDFLSLRALLAHQNFDPFKIDRAGLHLASLGCFPAHLNPIIIDYVKRYVPNKN